MKPMVLGLARFMRGIRDARVVAATFVCFVAAIAFVQTWRSQGDLRIASVTRVDNLEIVGTTTGSGSAQFNGTLYGSGSATFAGTAYVTGALTGSASIAAATGLYAAGASGPALYAGAGTPEGAVTAPVGSLYQRTNGAVGTAVYVKQSGAGNTGWNSITTGATGVPAITIQQQAFPASVNLSTLGTLDWLWPPLTQPTDTLVNALSSKFGGGWLRESFAWKTNGATSLTQNSGMTITSDTLDTLGQVLNTTNANGWFCNGCSATSFGATMRVPATTSNRVLRIYTNEFSETTTVTATLTDGSLAPVTSANTSPVGGGASTLWVITFQSASPNVDMVVTILCSAGTANGPQIKIAGITLGTS